jgi:hypothetical protein
LHTYAVERISTEMRRNWLRPITCVSLVAFFVANSHVGTAFAIWMAVKPAAAEQVSYYEPLHSLSLNQLETEASASSCHSTQHSERTFEPDEVQKDRGHEPCGPSCPDCPKEPHGPQCPCPGGCAICNPAKVPCLAHTPCLTSLAPSLSDNLPEATSIYTAPCAGRLIRPPRA